MRCRLEPEEAEVEIGAADEVEDITRREVADVHHHVDDGERHRALCGGRVTPRGGEQHRRAERFTDRERQNTTRQRQPWNPGCHHHGTRDRADRDAEIERALQPDGIRERAGEKREHCHRRRPTPSYDRARCLIAKPQVLRQPQDHGLIRDRVGGVDQELEQERKPELTSRSAEHREFPDESRDAVHRRNWDMFLGQSGWFRSSAH